MVAFYVRLGVPMSGWPATMSGWVQNGENKSRLTLKLLKNIISHTAGHEKKGALKKQNVKPGDHR